MKSDSQSPKIIAHHVGARGFGVSLNLPGAFRDEVVNVLYEADAEAVERMEGDQNCPQAQLLAEKYVLPYAIGRRNGKATLHITGNSYASSIFEPNTDFFRYYCEIPIDAATYDVTYREMLQVVKTIELDIHSLDSLFAERKVPITAPPDFLSLDTQGYELEILHGAEDIIKQGVLAMVCEVEMIPMYKGQPLLGDVLKFAVERGFLFAGFTASFEVSPFRAPIGARGKGLPGFGDALFFKDIPSLTRDEPDPSARYIKLHKLAFIAVSYGYMEFALAALLAAREIRASVSPGAIADFEKMKYARFLAELEQAVAKQEVIFPPVHSVPDDARPSGDNRTSWYNKHHEAALKHYHAMAASSGSAAASAGPMTQEAPVAGAGTPSVYRKLRSRLGTIARRYLSPQLVGILRRATAPAADRSPAIPSPDLAAKQDKTNHGDDSKPHPWTKIQTCTPVEKLLEDWGFGGPAYFVKAKRTAAEKYVRSLETDRYLDGALEHIPR